MTERVGSRCEYMLRTEGLTKRYQPPAGVRRLLMRSPITETITAVDNVDLEVRTGEVFGLLGPNGAGKTTLIKLLTTLLQPTQGRAWVCGYDTVAEEHKVRQVIGTTIGEERSFYWRLTGRQNLAFFASLAGVPRREQAARIESVLTLMDLERDGDNMFYSYSSGMKQKLAIARSLLGQPQVLFLDEPTKNVDALTANELKRLVRERFAGASAHTVLLATHRMEEAEQLCDRLAIVQSGRIAFCGTIAELRSRVAGADECVVRMSGIDSRRCVAFAALYGLSAAKVERPGADGLVDLSFTMRQGDTALSDVLRAVLAEGAIVLSVDRRERGLEEMFLDVVRGEARAS